eukprot:c25535_g1_i1 orf=210-1592(-)
MSVAEDSAAELASVLPRVLIVSRRTVRKNKFVDFVGEYHLDLIVKYGAVPVIVPRVSGVHLLLDSFEPVHGVLLCEGEDIDPSLYENDLSSLTADEIEEIRRLHRSDTSIDRDKDLVELQLVQRCLRRNIPYLGICRGSQVLNVACGGSLYQDVERELSQNGSVTVQHINYEDYDGHRHPVKVVEGTPLYEWFKESLDSDSLHLNVNSYHHQGVKRLGDRLRPMGIAPDGLIEAFYDPDAYDPPEGKFIVGLQFHPERMRHEENTNRSADSDLDVESVFDYPGCSRAYQEFVRTVVAYQKKLMMAGEGERVSKLDRVMEKRMKQIVRSFSAAKLLYNEQIHIRKNKTVHNGSMALESFQNACTCKNKDLEVGAEFLQSIISLSPQQEKILKQMGATVRSARLAFGKLKLLRRREAEAKSLLSRLPTEELFELLNFYRTMLEATVDILETRTQDVPKISFV